MLTSTTPVPPSFEEKVLDFFFAERAFLFGNFVTKSKRKTPYFFNLGRICEGRALLKLAALYEEKLAAEFPDAEVIYGPAYKGIPLCVAVTLSRALKQNLAPTETDGGALSYLFNRKEKKQYGDGGQFVGQLPTKPAKVVLVDDVITSGSSVVETMALFKAAKVPVKVLGVMIAFDRMEKNLAGTKETLTALEEEFSFKVRSLLNFKAFITLSRQKQLLPPPLLEDIAAYQKLYCYPR